MCNMGNFMRCCCLMLPISWTISTFVLVIWILVGSTSVSPFPADTYFLRMNVSWIDPAVTPAPGSTIAQTIGLHDFYQTGLWNYCEGYYIVDENWDTLMTGCSQEVGGYYFNPISIMASELMAPYQIVFIQQEVNAIQTIQSTSDWLKAAFVITALFTGFTLVIGPLTGVWHQRRLLNCLPVGTMCIAALFVFMGAVTATSVYFGLRDAFNNDTRLDVEAHMGHQMFAWVWLCVWTAWTAASQWCCAAICCPGGHRKHRVELRKPFPGLAGIIPIPWIGDKVKPRPDSQIPIVHDQVTAFPVAPDIYPQPPPAGEHHHTGALAAAGLGAMAGTALGLYQQHQEEQQHEPQEQHHGHPGGALAAGALGLAGGTALAAHQMHQQHQQQQQQAPPQSPTHHHNGALAAGALGAAAGAAMGAHHLHQQHQQHQQQQQQNQQPPQSPTHHDGALAAGAVGAMAGTALGAHHEHQQEQQQVQQQQSHHNGGLATAATVGALTGAALGAHHLHEEHQQQQVAPPPPAHHHNGALATGALGAAAGVALGAHEAHQAQQPQQIPPQPEPPGPPVIPILPVPPPEFPPPQPPVLMPSSGIVELSAADVIETVSDAPVLPETSGPLVPINTGTQPLSQGLPIAAATSAAVGLGLAAAQQNLPPPQPQIPPPSATATQPLPIQNPPVLLDPVVIPPPQQPPPQGLQLPQPPPTSGSINIPPPPPPGAVAMPIPGQTTPGGNQILQSTFPFSPTTTQPMVHNSLDQLFPSDPHRQ